MIHYKFEGCTEVREADVQFDVDNNEIGNRILKFLFGNEKAPCTLDFIREENGVYIFKRNWSFNHIYKTVQPKSYKKKRRWKENDIRKPYNKRWKPNWKRNNHIVKKINYY